MSVGVVSFVVQPALVTGACTCACACAGAGAIACFFLPSS